MHSLNRMDTDSTTLAGSLMIALYFLSAAAMLLSYTQPV